jgi:hypothetical protein
LHQTAGDKARLKTNLRVHVSHIKGSGHTDVIQLIKVWRFRAGIDIKTFPLELAVIAALVESKSVGLDLRFRDTLTCFRDNIDDLKEVFGDTQKEALKTAAKLALDMEADGGWESVLGTLQSSVSRNESVRRIAKHTGQILVPLDRSDHVELARWPERICGNVELHCSYQNDRGKTIMVKSDGPAVPPNVRLKFRAHTTVSAPHEVWWQVVNTGPHARAADCLRGRLFQSTNQNEPLVNVEPTRFSGKHWVECFIVRGGFIVARSGRFFVPIYNPERPFWRQ